MSQVFSDEQRMLVDSVTRWGEGVYTQEKRRGASTHDSGCCPESWQELGELGWLALPVPEQDGGLGGSLMDMGVLAESLGRVLLVEPFVSCAIMATTLLSDVAADDIRATWLPALAQGERRIAFAAWETGYTGMLVMPEARARHQDGQWRIDGNKELMPGVGGADGILVSARIDDQGNDLGIFLIQPERDGARVQNTLQYDGRHAARLELAGASGDLLKQGPQDEILKLLRRAIDRGILAHCAEVAGTADVVLSITRDYVTTRKQFGRSIASNQIIQHRLVDLFVEIEELKAFWRETALSPQSHSIAALAAHATAIAQHVWEEAIQLHGAIGMTEEYELGEYVRRLALATGSYGARPLHLESLAQLSLGES